MGKSSSSSQANQATTTANADNRIVNESGIVAQDSTLDMSSFWSNSNTTNTTDNSVMNLASYDSRDYSTHAAYNDSSNRSTNTTDNSVMNLASYDSRNFSTSNLFTDNSDRSTSNIFTDSRSTSSYFNDASDRSISNLFTDTSNRSTNLSSLDYSDRSTSNSTSNSTSYTDGRTSNSWDSSSAVTGSYNTTTTLDPQTVKAAFDFASGNDARYGAGLDKMLGYASELALNSQDNANSLASRFQDNVMQAYDNARTTTPGGIDQKTMIVLGVAAAAALAFMAKKG